MKKLKYVLDSLDAPHDEKTVTKFYDFMELVLNKNEFINLTSITDRDEFEVKHLMDSIMCYNWKEIKSANKIMDVGSGAGFPGVPLAIIYPSKQFFLIDSLNKRLEFINEACDNLNIKNIETLHMRAEDAGQRKEYREKFDLCVSRALANLSVLSEYCLPLVRVGGFLYAYKTKGIDPEIKESEMARKLLGSDSDIEIRERDIPGFELKHNILVIKKDRPTPKTYPRKAGTPSKVPL